MEILMLVLIAGLACAVGLWIASRPTAPEKKPGADFDGI
jgi:hypothetical protein